MRPRFPVITVLLAILVVAGLGLTAPSLVLSDHHYDSQWHDDDHTHDRARRALSDGDALPVSELLQRLHAQVEGDVVATKYEHEYERWVYEFKIVKPNGNLEYVHMDARTGEIVDISDQ
jgi:uncharacterized membrane protein YkoI